jgi:hypothetical protein
LTEQGFYDRFGVSIPGAWRKAAQKLPDFLVQADEYGIRFTPKGFLVSNGLITAILNL